jgi:phosphopantothenoylcysteine decarboxylase/phosphopantothenate--cysteine ligase
VNKLAFKNCLLIVTGSIAAYKTPDIVRRMRDQGAEVQVVLTSAANEFVTPLALQAVSGNEVRQDLFDHEAEAGMGHIELARWADAIVVAPASADYIAKLSKGVADDLSTAICRASDAPILIAPAMNQLMWENSFTKDALDVLLEKGFCVCGPDSGSQACGEVGLGRLVEAEILIESIASLFNSGSMARLRVMVTAGPTRERIDPVRYLTNQSSGKMGYALARAACEAGANVILISGPTNLVPPKGVGIEHISSATEMETSVSQNVEDIDIFIACAAVSDYRPEEVSGQKIKKSDSTLSLKLIPNKDILASVAGLKNAPFTVGFAAETEELERFARDKMTKKGVDMIAANLVDNNGLGFNSDDNELTVFWQNQSYVLEKQPKEQLARKLVALISKIYQENH